MIDTDKYEGHTQGHWATTTRKGTWVVYTQDNGDVATMNDYEDAKLIAAAPLLLEEVKRLREVILDFSMPMWNYLNSQVHPDQEGFTSNAVKSLVKNTPYESLMHLWEDACGYLPDPDCDDTLRNKPVWNTRWGVIE
tara:strand:- start:5800 stop:6210 length:411 start_codon:yes stop_codon:yes gene_type:complete